MQRPATRMHEVRLAQAAVALAACVPVLAGGAGIVLGDALLGTPAGANPALDSHVRYLSGLLLGIGLAFWSTVPALPRHHRRFALLTAIVVLGGLARLAALPAQGWPGAPMAAALLMELVVTPLLFLWQRRIAHGAANG